MNKSEILSLLNQQLAFTRQHFGTKHVALFGSASRDELRAESDIDVLVEFEELPTFDNYMGLKLHLEKLLGRRVDLVTPNSIKPRMREIIEKDLISIA
jgi:uncharacterized protein